MRESSWADLGPTAGLEPRTRVMVRRGLLLGRLPVAATTFPVAAARTTAATPDPRPLCASAMAAGGKLSGFTPVVTSTTTVPAAPATADASPGPRRPTRLALCARTLEGACCVFVVPSPPSVL